MTRAQERAANIAAVVGPLSDEPLETIERALLAAARSAIDDAVAAELGCSERPSLGDDPLVRLGHANRAVDLLAEWSRVVGSLVRSTRSAWVALEASS